MSPWNAKIVRVDQPEPGLLSLSVRSEGRKEVLVLVTLPGALGLGLIDDRPRGASAGPALTQLRRHLEGARVESVERSRRAARLSLTRSGSTRFLIAAPSKPYGAWWLCETDGTVVVRSPGAQAAAPVEDGHLESLAREELLTSGTAALDAHRRLRRQQLERLLQRHLKRLTKKRDAILEDLRRATRADELHERASLILAHLSEIPANARFFETESWEAEPQPIRIELEPPKSPTETAQQLFKKAKRLKRGLDVAPLRLDSVEDEIAELQRVQDELTGFSTEELKARLEALGVSTTAPKERERRRRQAGERLPYREFRSGEASAVLVGRGAADNDRLTLRIARPHDLWLHARGVTGAHVVVPLTKGQSCSAETLVDAATLAAHFSDLRGEAIVDVLYTPRRFVRKRRGSPVGSVTLEREKVIAVRIEAERLKRLLENERKQST